MPADAMLSWTRSDGPLTPGPQSWSSGDQADAPGEMMIRARGFRPL